MHQRPSDTSLLRDLLETTVVEKSNLKEKVDSLLSELDIECDVSADNTWVEQYYCGIHGTHFRDKNETYICPVGKFALELKRKHE